MIKKTLIVEGTVQDFKQLFARHHMPLQNFLDYTDNQQLLLSFEQEKPLELLRKHIQTELAGVLGLQTDDVRVIYIS